MAKTLRKYILRPCYRVSACAVYVNFEFCRCGAPYRKLVYLMKV